MIRPELIVHPTHDGLQSCMDINSSGGGRFVRVNSVLDDDTPIWVCVGNGAAGDAGTAKFMGARLSIDEAQTFAYAIAKAIAAAQEAERDPS